MTITFTQGDARPDWGYQMLTGTILADGRVAALGYNPDNDTASIPEDTWSGAALGILNAIDHKLIQFAPAGGVSMEVISDNANDTSAGTGARTVSITYLTSAYVSTTVTITLNGTTPVALGTGVVRINAFTILTAGTTPRGVNTGNLSIRLTGGAGATYSYMLAGTGIAQSSLYTVPTGRVFDILALLLSVHQVDTSTRAATFSLSLANSSGRQIKGLFLGVTSTAPYLHHNNGRPIVSVPSTFDTWITCENVSANNTAVSAAMIGVLR